MTPYITTFTGKKFHFLEPNDDEIDIKDIAYALANQCRFNGHVPFFSVAEHSVAVAARLHPSMQLAGLLHDAAEAYLSDIPSPVKQFLPDYQAMEETVQNAIHKKFGLDINPTTASAVKAADQEACWTEAHYLLRDKGADWVPVVFKPEKKWQPRLLPPPEAVQMFQHWFYELTSPETSLARKMGLDV